MKKSILSIALACLISSCSLNSETPTQETIYNNYEIPFLKNDIAIPQGFSPISLIDAERVEPNSPLYGKLINTVKAMAFSKVEFDLFAQDANSQNLIYLQKTPYVPLTKELASAFIGQIDQKIREAWSVPDYTFERTEGRFMQNDGADFIKVTFKLSGNNENYYLTQYIATADLETVTITILHDTEEDYQAMLAQF